MLELILVGFLHASDVNVKYLLRYWWSYLTKAFRLYGFCVSFFRGGFGFGTTSIDPSVCVQFVQARGPGRGPIFEDGPGFESSFRLFHGKDGVVPLARTSKGEQRTAQPVADASEAANLTFHPLSARAAAISLSPFGPAGPCGFDGFMANYNAKKPNKKQQPKKKEPQPEKEHKSNIEAHVSALHILLGSI